MFVAEVSEDVDLGEDDGDGGGGEMRWSVAEVLEPVLRMLMGSH